MCHKTESMQAPYDLIYLILRSARPAATSRRAVRPVQSAVHWVSGSASSEEESRGVGANHLLHRRLRMRGALPSLPLCFNGD